eukprot:4658827-Alexandrium_andersonii.AAC.1
MNNHTGATMGRKRTTATQPHRRTMAASVHQPHEQTPSIQANTICHITPASAEPELRERLAAASQ